MPPGNWDGPFILSPHDPNTVYAGLNELFVSRDQGQNWTSLGDLTTGTDRRTLRIMDQQPDSFVLSLDDGIPYWPTLAEIAESPLEEGVLYVGTDDGLVQVSRDGGQSWTDVTDRIPELPEMTWLNGFEPSRHAASRVYMTTTNYRNDDYANYVYRSEDYGMNWERIDGGLPPERVTRVLREDPRNPDVLYLGTEMGLFISVDRGDSWTALDAGMPTMAFNDLVVHPRDNDLVLATHSRGIWIVDNVNALQEITPAVLASDLHLFSAEDARQIRYRSERGHTGDMIFTGDNPPAGGIVDFWLGNDVDPDGVSLSVLDGAGEAVARIPLRNPRAGAVNRVVWSLQSALGTPEEERVGPQGPPVLPGRYTLRLSGGGAVSETAVTVHADPRDSVPDDVRARWTQDLLEIQRLGLVAGEFLDQVRDAARELDGDDTSPRAEKIRDLLREAGELRSRAGRLVRSVSGHVGPLTGDEASQREFLSDMLSTLAREWDAMRGG